MKIGMLTLYDQAFEGIAQRTLPNKQWYADRQRYPLIVERELKALSISCATVESIGLAPGARALRRSSK